MSTPTPIRAQSVLDLIKNRRTYYQLNKELTISKERIQEIVKEALREVPSSFNSQPNRVIVLFDAEHDKFWNLAEEVLRTVVPPENWEPTGKKLAMFKAGAATILFFEDQNTVDQMAAKFPIFADKMPIWALQSDAMLQFTIWVALEAEGLGANLQHYNPIVDSKVAQEWNVPTNWRLNAQLVIGGRAAPPGEKTYIPDEERFRVFGA
ncbi:hypothetical protein VTK73DRAFT_8190 [Phialemonium thermophilum]|uniref:Nitroreductase domain-containing protein n=1 Tax=Phialemonium thermophilum TaxID=223376 RepID=A0ABR3XQR4_9PEZI